MCILRSNIWISTFCFHYKPKDLPLFTILNSHILNNSPIPLVPSTESKQDMRTISQLTANSEWIEHWMLYDRHPVAGEQSEWEIIWRTHGSNRMHMEQDCVLARTCILWKRTAIICVPLITTMEWCNPQRLDLTTHYSRLEFCFQWSLTFLLVFCEC